MISINFKKFDWILLGLIVILACISLVTLYSIDQFYFSRQAVWFLVSFFIIIFGSQIKWSLFISQKWFRYGFFWFSVILLFIPFLQPGLVRGTESWIKLGFINYQPSELVKLSLIILLAGFFSRKYLAAWQSKNILKSFIYTIIPVGIIAIQPDLGSAIVVFGVWLGFILMNGINKKRFLIGILLVILLFVIMWSSFLKPYQKERILGFISPSMDPLGVNYNVTQSKIAIGSAGFFGKGFRQGTQVQLGFLPEPHTDFLFASFIEEWGIFGGLILILTYLAFIIRMAVVGLRLRRNDLKFVVLGVGLVFLIHFFINIGSNLGLVPVIGISLPFISYGGSNLLTSSLALAIIECNKIESSY